LKRIRKTKGIRVYQNIVKSKGLNVNYGVSKSKGEFIGVIDADTFIAPNIFNKMIGYFANPKVGSVFANIVPRNTRKLIEKYQEIEYTYVSFVRQAMAAIETMYVTPGGGFPLYRKRVFEQVGGYCGPEILTEDFEMGVKLIKAGYIIKVTRDAKTFTNVPSTFMRLFKQRVRWYRGTLQTYKKHRDMLFNTKYPFVSFFILPLFFVLTTIIFVIYLNVGLGLVDSLSLGYNQVSTMLELGYLPSLNFNFLNLNVLFLFSHLTIFLTINFVIWLLAFKEGLRISGKSLRFNIILGIIVTILYGPITLLFYVKAFYDEFRAKPNKWW